MVQYDLTVFQRGQTSPMFKPFPLSPSPYGSFNKGDILDLRGGNAGVWTIIEVRHAIVPGAGGWVSRTLVFVDRSLGVTGEPGDDNPTPWPW